MNSRFANTMIVNEVDVRKIVRQLILEDAGVVDTEEAAIQADEEILDALKVDDPKNPEQKIIGMYNDGTFKVYVKDEKGNESEIKPETEEFHNALGAIVNSTLDSKKKKPIKILLNYLKKLYPEAEKKDNLLSLIRRYRQLST